MGAVEAAVAVDLGFGFLGRTLKRSASKHVKMGTMYSTLTDMHSNAGSADTFPVALGVDSMQTQETDN